MSDPSHADLLAELRVQGSKLDTIHRDIGEVKTTLSNNTARLASVERWISSHDAIVRFVKWGVGLAVGVAAVAISFWALLRK